MSANTSHIIVPLPVSADYGSAESAVSAAKINAELSPNKAFGVYALVATVTAKVEISVEIANANAAPVAKTSSCGLAPDYYPHLRRVPPELLPLPDGAVYLGKGGEFKQLPLGEFRGWGWTGADWVNSHFQGHTPSKYCAPVDSEIVKLNRETAKW